MNTEQKSPSEVKVPARPYSCMGSPPIGSNNVSEEKKPAGVAAAMEFHEKHVSASVADMRGQF